MLCKFSSSLHQKNLLTFLVVDRTWAIREASERSKKMPKKIPGSRALPGMGAGAAKLAKKMVKPEEMQKIC